MNEGLLYLEETYSAEDSWRTLFSPPWWAAFWVGSVHCHGPWTSPQASRWVMDPDRIKLDLITNLGGCFDYVPFIPYFWDDCSPTNSYLFKGIEASNQ